MFSNRFNSKIGALLAFSMLLLATCAPSLEEQAAQTAIARSVVAAESNRWAIWEKNRAKEM